MPITIEDISSNLKTLPEEFYEKVNDFVDFLKIQIPLPKRVEFYFCHYFSLYRLFKMKSVIFW